MNEINIFKNRRIKLLLSKLIISCVILFTLTTNAFCMSKTVKGTLIGLGAGLAIGTTYSFCTTYDFKRGHFTTDPMKLVVTWTIIPPLTTIIGGTTGGIVGYKSKRKK